MPPQPRINIFWDLESCPPPTSYPGSPWDLLKAIRLFTSRFGIVTTIKAYWGGSDATIPEANTGPLRAAMPSMGISLVDCSLVREYSRDALPRTLAVDVLLSAIDNSHSLETQGRDIMVILSGDRSILHPICPLILRGYIIYLIVPDEIDNIEQSRASKVFRWHAEVLGLKSDPSPESTTVSNTECSTPEGQSLNGLRISPNLRGGGLENTSSIPPPQPSITSHPSASNPPGSMAFSYPTTLPQLPKDATSHLKSPRKLPVSKPPLRPGSPSVFSSVATPAMTPKTKARSIPAFEPPSSRTPSVMSFDSGTTPVTFGNVQGGGTGANSSKSPDIRAQMLGQISPSPAREETHANNDWGAGSGWNENGDWEMSTSSWLPESEPKATPEAGRSFQPEPEPKPEVPRTNQPRPELETSTVDISVFIPLLQNLQKARAEGKKEVLRSVLGGILAKDKTIYQVAGVATFNAYIMMAAQKGLVTLGGTGGKAWVALK